MSTGIFLSYKGLGSNLLHLSYCHEIAKKFGPVEIITLSNNLNDVIEDDPLIKKVTYLDKYHKKVTDILKLSNFLILYGNLLDIMPLTMVFSNNTLCFAEAPVVKICEIVAKFL